MAPKIAFERRKAKVKELDDRLTPLEIAAALETDAEIPFMIAPLLRSGQRPVSYSREVWSEDATYYSSDTGAKTLIVAFCGTAGRLGVPISYFLQMLREDEFDVVVFRDPRQLHYTHGFRGLGSFLETMTQIKRFVDVNSFQKVLTLGTSMGGFPALRAGRLLGARRAFSIGGRYPWHPGRLMRGNTPVPAFNALCSCASPSPTELVSVYARGNELDTHADAQLRKTFSKCTSVPINIKEHGVFGYFYRAHLLPPFLACLLDYWDEAQVRNDLLGRLEYAARHARVQEALDRKRSRDLAAQEALRRRTAEKKIRSLTKRLESRSRELQAIYDSQSWRVTGPLRAIKRMLARE